jgi:hypothetical protein
MPCVFTEWLVLRGDVTLSPTDNPNTNEKGLPLSEFDYHRSLRPLALTATAGQDGALIFLRDSLLEQKIATTPEDLAPLTLRHTGIPWQDHGPNIKRRVLWQQGAMGSMLYLTEAGAFVPQHRHDHDEECFMVRGDVFLDDCLLREGDYQLAPAGTGHHTTSTDTGCIIYAHGDLDMQFLGN